MGIVNARLMAETAIQFNIGADILGKGSRFVEKYFGAEKMSGDTVMVPIDGNGKVFDKIDLSGEDLSIARDAVPVSVKPLATAAMVDAETLTLSVKQPSFMAKRVANMALEANKRACRCLEANTLTTLVVSSTDVTGGHGEAAREKVLNLLAYCDGSKLDGQTYGVIQPLTYSKLCALYQTTVNNDKIQGDLYKMQLGQVGGIDWTKGMELHSITGKTLSATCGSIDYSAVIVEGTVQAPDAVPSNTLPTLTGTVTTGAGDLFETGAKVGDLSRPFTLPGVYVTDIFGNSTGVLATFRMRKTGANTAVLAAPVFFEGPRQNVTSEDYDLESHVWTNPDNETAESVTTYGTVGTVLADGKRYLSPAIVWKKDDFLVAVKGLEKFFACDSFTIPTAYKDRGILPLRGLCQTDGIKGTTIFRVDVLMGMAAYTRTSMAAIYFEA